MRSCSMCMFLTALLLPAGCGTYYGSYTIDTVPTGARVIGPDNADWGTTPLTRKFKSDESGCKTYSFSAQTDHCTDWFLSVEACATERDPHAADRAVSDADHKKVYRLTCFESSQNASATTSEPAGDPPIDLEAGRRYTVQSVDGQPLDEDAEVTAEDLLKCGAGVAGGAKAAGASYGLSLAMPVYNCLKDGKLVRSIMSTYRRGLGM